MWEHRKSHHQYTELLGSSRAKSATTGRWVKVDHGNLVEIVTPESLAEAEAFVRREHLQHLAWQLSRELSYNVGTAITHLALANGDRAMLLTAIAAIRDEVERSGGTEGPDGRAEVLGEGRQDR